VPGHQKKFATRPGAQPTSPRATRGGVHAVSAPLPAEPARRRRAPRRGRTRIELQVPPEIREQLVRSATAAGTDLSTYVIAQLRRGPSNELSPTPLAIARAALPAVIEARHLNGLITALQPYPEACVLARRYLELVLRDLRTAQEAHTTVSPLDPKAYSKGDSTR
jgi:hypothetical protein